jgi:hypothetical protein
VTVGTRLQLRRNTAANWATDNPVLLSGEMGVETDTHNVKVGDGTTVWNLLAYANAAANAFAPLTGGTAITGTEPHQADTSFIANVGPVLTAPGGQQMRVRVNAAGVVQLDPIGAIQPAVFIPLLGSTTPVTGTASSMVINVPAGTVNGSVMVAVISNRGSQTINTPVGWSLIRTTTGGAFDSTPQLSTFYRVASSEPASYTWTFSASTIFSGSIATFGNVNTTTPVSSSVELRGSGGDPSLSIGSVAGYGMVLFAAAVDTYNGTTTNGNGSVTDPAGSVPVWDVAQGPYAHSHLSLISAPAAGGTVSASAVHSPSGSNFASQLVALNPASVVSASLPQLRWAPPNTSGYTTQTINTNGGVQQTINLTPGVDYVISAPSTISGGVVLSGGRNVVWIGGEISIPNQSDQGTSDNTNRRALLLSGQTGVVHIEGLLLDGTDINEGIDVAAPNAVVQIQNVRAVNMHAHDESGFTDNHVDFIQTWGGCQELRVDKCTFQSDYQGITVKDDFNSSRHVCRLSRINGKSYNNLGQYFYWFDATAGKRGDVYLEDIWAPSDALYTDIGKQVWPDKNNQLTAFPQRAIVNGTSVSWPSQLSPMIVGTVTQGQPAADFAPSGTPGLGIAGAGYTTPGYQYASYVAPVIYSAILSGSLSTTSLSDFVTTGLGATVTVNPGDFAALSADNTTAIFAQTSSAAVAGLCGGLSYIQSTAHPCPATAGSLTANVNAFQMRGVT